MSDRTLDQQCTVTRPGIAAIASALLVEIMVSVLQHPQGILAPAPDPEQRETGAHPLGIVPHQIRGFLSTFQNMVISGKSYDCCSACSDKITGLYRQGGWEFVKKALNEKGFVEEVSGLAEVSVLANPEHSSGWAAKNLRFSVRRRRQRRMLIGTKMTKAIWRKEMGSLFRDAR
jgi:hypothetical protein